MSVSKLKINPGALEATFLAHLQAHIMDLEVIRRGDGSKYLILHIEGPDVPDSEFVVATSHLTIKLDPV